MKRLCFVIVFLFLAISLFASQGTIKKISGTVTAIDPDGKAIVIVEKIGKEELVVGTIITPETLVKVKGKKANLDEIKVGDRITLIYERSDDLYAKEIIKQ